MSRMSRVLPAGREERILSAATFVYSAGFGSFVGSSAIFFTQSVGLGVGAVGAGTAVAGLLAVVAALPAGRLTDRVGARNLLLVLSVAQAVLCATYALVHDFTSFLLAVCALTAADQGARVARNTVIAGMAAGRGRVELKAHLRSVSNLGISLGMLVSAVPLYLDTRGAYLAVIFCNAGAGLVTAVLVKQLPRRPAAASSSSAAPRGWVALRDVPYMSVAVLCGLLATYQSLLTIAMPLWVTLYTDVPRPYIAVLLVCNTILGIVLQVHAGRRADTAAAARRTARQGARLILPACALFAAAPVVPVPLAMLLLAAGVAVLTVGDLWTSVAAWSLSYELADDRVPGQYQGAFALGMSVETVVGPLLATGLVLGLGTPGWLTAGLLSALLGTVLANAARWALRTRPPVTAGLPVDAEPTVRLALAAPTVRVACADATLRLAYPDAATDLLSADPRTANPQATHPQRPRVPAGRSPQRPVVYAVGRSDGRRPRPAAVPMTP
jgi:MFS family permease